MKKLWAIMMMAIFVISLVPLAIADEEGTGTDNSQSTDTDNSISYNTLVGNIRAYIISTEHDNILACVGDVQNRFWSYDAEFVEKNAREFCLAWANLKEKDEQTQSEINNVQAQEDIEALTLRIREYIAQNSFSDLFECEQKVVDGFLVHPEYVKSAARHFCLAWMNVQKAQETTAQETGKESQPGKSISTGGMKAIAAVKKLKVGKTMEEWKDLEKQVREYVNSVDHDSFEACIGNVQNKLWEEDANWVKSTAEYYCAMWRYNNMLKEGKEAKKEAKENLKEITQEIKATQLKKAVEVIKNNPDLMNAMSKFTQEQKDLMAKYFSRARYEWCLENPERCREALKNIALEFAPVKERIVDEKTVAEARRRYAAYKEEQDKAIENAKESKDAFLNLKKKGASDEQLLEEAKVYLANKISIVQGYLNKMKERIDMSDSISDEKAKELTADIETGLNKLNELSEKTKQATTKEDIRAIAEEVKSVWKHFGLETEGVAVGLMQDKVMDVIVRSNNLEEKLYEMLQGAELRNIDIDVANDLVAEFSAEIEGARDAYQESRELLAKANEMRKDIETASEDKVKEYKAVVEQSKAKLSEARDHIFNAQKLLDDIIAKLREAYRNKPLKEISAENSAAADTSASEDGQSGIECKDHDTGRDIFTASSVTGFSGYMNGEFIDFCSNNEDGIGTVEQGQYVHEYSCDKGGLVIGNTYECENGCVIGACVK